MTTIQLSTIIKADIGKCFDAARDIDLHQKSTFKTNEKAISGRTAGLGELGDTITWEAVHFGIRQILSVEITKFEYPIYFEDKMLKGAFKSMRHEHHFQKLDNQTIMTDYFEYEVPFGVFGKLFDQLILKKYMTKFLSDRNLFLKSVCEKL